MSKYLRREMRGDCGPYWRLEEKWWDHQTRRSRTRQIQYFGKVENVPREIMEIHLQKQGEGTTAKDQIPQTPKNAPNFTQNAREGSRVESYRKTTANGQEPTKEIVQGGIP